MGDIISNYQCRVQLTMRDTYMIVFGSDVQFNYDYLEWMDTYTKNGKPYKWIICLNQVPRALKRYPRETELGTVDVCGMNGRIFENVYIVYEPQVLYIGEKKCLFLPGQFDLDDAADITRTCVDNNISIDYVFSYTRPILTRATMSKRDECMKYIYEKLNVTSWIAEI